MNCPRCKLPMQPTMIEEHLPAMACASCEGSLVSLLYYRHWAETQKSFASAPAENAGAAAETTDTPGAIVCPKCSRVMMKYKITGTISNRLDVCRLCDEAWLDRGEWELLEALQLSHQMPSIFTEEWQRRIRRELTEDARRTMLTRAIGDTGFEKVEAFRAWLTQNRHKPDIMAYLYRN